MWKTARVVLVPHREDDPGYRRPHPQRTLHKDRKGGDLFLFTHLQRSVRFIYCARLLHLRARITYATSPPVFGGFLSRYVCDFGVWHFHLFVCLFKFIRQRGFSSLHARLRLALGGTLAAAPLLTRPAT